MKVRLSPKILALGFLIGLAAGLINAEAAQSDRVVVMLGDSLTAGTDWSPLAKGGIQIYNHGVPNDGVKDVVKRLDRTLDLKPGLVILQIGVNDLSKHLTTQETIKNHLSLWRMISRARSRPKLLVCSLLTVNPDRFGEPAAQELNTRILELNEHLARAARKEGHMFLDLNGALAGHGNSLGPDLTGQDGLHLTAKAYIVWRAALTPYLAEAD
jgi:lysophospholipase L1-like esterase